MSHERRDEATSPRAPPRLVDKAFESGVVVHDGTSQGVPDHAPPWDVVHAYLSRREHRFWVESHAARSPSFAAVLSALCIDHEELERGVVVPLRRRS